MAIDTTNEKLALMEEELWEPALPISPSTFGQDDQQQLLWGFPGVLWQAGQVIGAFILDLNSRIKDYLVTTYSVDGATADATTLVRRYLNTAGGDATKAFQTLIDDATP